jgi:hypothetical protein
MTDPSGYAETLALPADFDVPRLLRYDTVTGHAITRDDLGADVRRIEASLDVIRETRRAIRRRLSLNKRHRWTALHRAVVARGRRHRAQRAVRGRTRPRRTWTTLDLDDLADALASAAASRRGQASPEQETERVEAPKGPDDEEWRRRESNPRNIRPVICRAFVGLPGGRRGRVRGRRYLAGLTVIPKVARPELALESTALQVTAVRPTGNRAPERGSHVTGTTPSRASRAVTL